MKDYPYFKAYTSNIMVDIIGMSQSQKGDYLDSLLRSWIKTDTESMPEWLSEQVDHAMSKSKKLGDNAKQRWRNLKENSNSDAKAMQKHSNCNAKAMQTPYIDREKEREIDCNAKAYSPFNRPDDRPLTAEQLEKVQKVILGELPEDTEI